MNKGEQMDAIIKEWISLARWLRSQARKSQNPIERSRMIGKAAGIVMMCHVIKGAK